MVPYALPFSEPYVTARGIARAARDGAAAADHRRGARSAWARRCRWRCAAAPTGRGRARDPQGHPPPAPRRPLRLRRRGADAGRGRCLHPHGRRTADPGAGQGGARDGRLRPRRQGVEAAAVVAARRRGGGAGPLQRHARLGRGRRGRRRRGALGRAWLSDLQAQARRRRRRRPGAGGSRDASGPRRGSASTPTGPGRVERPWRAGEIEPLGIELAEQPVGRPPRGWRRSPPPRSIPIAADETRRATKDAERAKRDGRLRPARP